MLVKSAPLLWTQIKGIICVHKPAEVSVRQVRHKIMTKICAELNEMEVRPPSDYVHISRNEEENKFEVMVQENLADHPLVVGPRYILDDMQCSWSNFLGYNTSGVLLLGLKTGTKIAKQIRENQPTRAYRMKGVLGQATENFFKSGKVVERSTFRHVKQFYMEKLLASMQAAHQRKMFELSGVDIHSQAAFELAAQGLIRPKETKIPLVYGLKCVHFQPPEFTIEVQCVNEYESYLLALIHEIGMKLHSTAHCTAIKCIRHSHFTIDDALLRRHWHLQHIITNMETCRRILDANDGLLNQENAILQ